MSDLFNKYDESIRLSYQHSIRMLMHLKNIISTLNSMDGVDDLTKEVYRDSIIKKYEMLEDLSWKLLSKIFKSMGLELNNPRSCYRHAFKEGLIDDIDTWNEILASRNTTAHIYSEEDYEKIKNKIMSNYVDAIEKLLLKINERVM
ncbi:nucleotidyltransferase substrate binding protein [Radiobacillus kanasensis]|uniref:HI0074 family nucleotidyltransferase substrate-binding subunit n=1 Tax=Radiobacillus kanasensis TaxID=2844358 RepID=UPI001E5007EF|nr:HI0074 family nucleotidyltransferase substrate-binding subunit [Radiobacillus kanasensis]UFT99844.1 nucleotidyltransferase substrate binding protein [Radiobacillus kanasensis]